MQSQRISGVSGPERVLATWQMLEQFNPQQLPSLSKRAVSSTKQTIDWNLGDKLPWDVLPSHPAQTTKPTARTPRNHSKEKPHEWRHTLYLGVYQIPKIYETLHRVFVDDDEAYDPRRGGVSAAAKVVLNASGELSPGSQIVSGALWGVGRAHCPGPQNPAWLDGFDEATEKLGIAIDELQAARRDESNTSEPPPIDEEGLLQLVNVAHRATGVTNIKQLAPTTVRISSYYLPIDSSADDSDFLNSFILDDVIRIRRAAGSSKRLGKALTDYLTPKGSEPRDRIDMIDEPAKVDALLGPDRLPAGRWPSDPKHPLALNQQFAVNQAVTDLHDRSGILAVNGPPGTGKTTMLRDVLAGLVVDRAREISGLERANDAFTGEKLRWKNRDDKHRIVHVLRPKLTGFEMVVASSNNAAVENVSNEMPVRSALGDKWSKNADYFTELASYLLSETDPERETTAEDSDADSVGQAWGLIAAKLGKSANRRTAGRKLWRGDKESGLEGLNDYLDKLRSDHSSPRRSWQSAREKFQKADDRVRAMIRDRQSVQSRSLELNNAPSSLAAASGKVDATGRELRESEDRFAQACAVEREALRISESSRAEVDRHLQVRPGFWENLFSGLSKLPAWRGNHEEKVQRTDAADSSAGHASQLRIDSEQQTHRARRVHHKATSVLESTRRRVAWLENECANDRTQFADSLPREMSDPGREKQAPWLDEELNDARSELFLAALDLHRDLIENAANQFYQSLLAAMDVMQGDVPYRLEANKKAAAWQALFLLIPLVSTTFASVPRMFAGLGQESLGWLFIDEAGQATPQLAAGAIWRFSRVLAVGDPMQLEPVMTVPAKATLDIATHFDVSDIWLAPRASVQTLADRVNRYGTTIGSGENGIWVGSPLRIHRRCDDPMFSISNAIAYDGLMISDVKRSGDPTTDVFSDQRTADDRIAKSYWADRPATVDGDHLQPTEIVAFKHALNYLKQKGVPDSEILAVSPFKAVADALEAETSHRSELRAGTIHVAQGREADVVILVLGGARDRPGATGWASRNPNLLNVAVSRAKRRLYVIGDHRAWKGMSHFDRVAKDLCQRSAPAGRKTPHRRWPTSTSAPPPKGPMIRPFAAARMSFQL